MATASAPCRPQVRMVSRRASDNQHVSLMTPLKTSAARLERMPREETLDVAADRCANHGASDWRARDEAATRVRILDQSRPTIAAVDELEGRGRSGRRSASIGISCTRADVTLRMTCPEAGRSAQRSPSLEDPAGALATPAVEGSRQRDRHRFPCSGTRLMQKALIGARFAPPWR